MTRLGAAIIAAAAIAAAAFAHDVPIGPPPPAPLAIVPAPPAAAPRPVAAAIAPAAPIGSNAVTITPVTGYVLYNP